MIIGISETEEIIIKDILAPLKDEYDFCFYGSRVKGSFSKVSDLDILVKGQEKMPLDVLETLKQQFDNSSLPYVVNFSDYNSIDKNFYESIKKDLVQVFF